MNTENKNKEDFLNLISKKKSGFTTPKKYFSEAENRFTTFLSEEKLPKKRGFKTPNLYFNSLEDVLLNKVTTTKKEVKIIGLKQQVFKYIPFAVAASIILFIGLNSFGFNVKKSISFDDIADTELENWVFNNTSLISQNDLTMAYTDISLYENEIISSSISIDEIENYLSEEDDISLILENN